MKAHRHPGELLPGRLIYSKTEYGFRFEVQRQADLAARSGTGGRTSISIDTLQIEVDALSGNAVYAWGYEPHSSWKAGLVDRPDSVSGTVMFDPGEPFEEGVSYPLPCADWERIYDVESGWIQVSAPHVSASGWRIEICTGVVLGGVGDELDSVFLHPTIED